MFRYICILFYQLNPTLMSDTHMSFIISRRNEIAWTNMTFIRSFSSVNPHMILDMSCCIRGIVTLITNIFVPKQIRSRHPFAKPTMFYDFINIRSYDCGTIFAWENIYNMRVTKLWNHKLKMLWALFFLFFISFLQL